MFILVLFHWWILEPSFHLLKYWNNGLGNKSVEKVRVSGFEAQKIFGEITLVVILHPMSIFSY